MTKVNSLMDVRLTNLYQQNNIIWESRYIYTAAIHIVPPHHYEQSNVAFFGCPTSLVLKYQKPLKVTIIFGIIFGQSLTVSKTIFMISFYVKVASNTTMANVQDFQLAFCSETSTLTQDVPEEHLI